MKKFLLLSAVLTVAACAQAQVQYISPGKAYTFLSDTAATGADISYQWYRNGQPISGATGESYNLPASLAYGISIVFVRGAVSSTCPGETVYSNAFTVTFCDMFVGSTCWASANVNFPTMFAPRPDMYTAIYRWNLLTAWPAAGSVSGWSATSITDASWTVNPCPEGWRLPTHSEIIALNNSSTPAGGSWAGANTRGNAVPGRFFGSNHANCVLPNNMTNCIFLSAGGHRSYNDGALLIQGSDGRYWSDTQSSANLGYCLAFDNSTANPDVISDKMFGRNIRCVQ